MKSHGAVAGARGAGGTWPRGSRAGCTSRARSRLLESALVDVPTVIGWMKPVILLPASALAGLSPAQLEAILAHELAHIRRHDYLVNLLQTLVETLLFYHPAVWWLSRRIRIERENCCDDLAVSLCGDPVAYAQALADLEELRGRGGQLVMAANGGSLVHRVRRLLGAPSHAGRGPGWLAGSVAVLLMLGIAAGALADGRVGSVSQRTRAPAAAADRWPCRSSARATAQDVGSASRPPAVASDSADCGRRSRHLPAVARCDRNAHGRADGRRGCWTSRQANAPRAARPTIAAADRRTRTANPSRRRRWTRWHRRLWPTGSGCAPRSQRDGDRHR